MGRTFWVSTSCWSYVTLSSGMSVVTSCTRRRRTAFRSGPFLSSRTSAEQEAAISWQVSCRPLDCENVELPKQTSPLVGSCERDDGVQVFLPFTSRTRSTHWRQCAVGQRSDTCFASTLLPHRSPRQFVSPTPGDSGRLGALRTGGMSSNARTPWDEGCGPVPAAVC